MYDLVIRGATVIDGSGQPGFRADVAVAGAHIAAVGEVPERGRREFDADGLAVIPGFVDGHTHLDAQIFWDELGSPSCWNGVTSVVMGNCGFTLAPSRAGARHLVVRNLERAEDISARAMELGIDWDFETFPEYLDVLDRLPKAINYATQVGHSALRTWVMGERAFTEAAGAEDLAAMRATLADALTAGAIGFTTSRSGAHQTADGRPVASRVAEWSEVAALAATAGAAGAMFELAVEPGARGRDAEVRAEFYDRLLTVALESRATVTFGVFSTDAGNPREWRDGLDFLDRARARGARAVGQSHARGVTIYNSFLTQLPFDQLPVWAEFRRRPPAEQLAGLRDPERRAALIAAVETASYGETVGAESRPPDFERMRVLHSPLPPNPTLAELAAQRGQAPIEVLLDLAIESELTQFFVQPFGDDSPDTIETMLRHDGSVMTFSDAGAHVSQIVDAGLQSYFIAHWARQRQVFPLERAVQMVTSAPAAVWGLGDRGLVRAGYRADLNLIDPHRLGPLMPEVISDLPGGEKRLDQRSAGIHATIVDGCPTIVAGEATGERPGRLIRGRAAGTQAR